MELSVYNVGEKVCEPSREMTQFDMTDGGGLLIVKFNHPTAKERREFKKPTQFKFLVVDDVIMILARFGTLNWMDAPYYRYRSKNLTYTEFPEDDMGFAVHILFIDSSTGILVDQKLIGLDTDTSRALYVAIGTQPVIPDYDKRIAKIYQKYSTEDFVQVLREQQFPLI